MAITIKAKNLNVIVNASLRMVAKKKISKVADKINIEATNDNLKLFSNKKITSYGNKQ